MFDYQAGLVHMDECQFEDCVWYLSAKLHDRTQVDALVQILQGVVIGSIPKAGKT